MNRLLKLIMSVWPAMLAGGVLSILTIFSNIGLMGISAFLIATAALHPSVAALSTAIVGVRFFGIARALCRYAERYLSHNATFQLLSRLRVHFYKALEPLVPAGLGEYRTGDLLSRMAGDVEALQFFYLRVIAPPVAALVILSGTAYWLSRCSGKLGAVLLAGFLTAGILLPSLIKLLAGNIAGKIGHVRGQLQAVVADSIQGLAEIEVFGLAKEQARAISKLDDRSNAFQKRMAGATALAEALGGFTANFTVWLALVLAIPMVRAGQVSGVELATIALVIESSFEAVLPLSMLYLQYQESRQAAARLFTVIDTKPSVAEQGDEALLDTFDIEFDQVGFSYDGKTKALDNACFIVKHGRRTAIVGESGAGKSSIIALLLRFWDCKSGSIKLNGKDIKRYKPESLRRLFGVVPQNAYLFNAAIRDNILLAKPDATEKEINQALEMASLKIVLNSLPDGLETVVGENGRALSGGQRQRVAIARAILQDAPVLILDEPTVGLDAITELEVMKNIKKVMAGRTTILITHRLVGLEAMDEIIVLENGKAIEQGTQAELIARGGLFCKMWHQQKNHLG